MDASDAVSYLVLPELQSKAAQIAIEAHKLARQARRQHVTAEDVGIAWACLSGRRNPLPTPAGDVKLLVSHAAARPLSAPELLLPTASSARTAGVAASGSGADGSKLRGSGGSGGGDDSRETAAVLAALTASIHSVGGGGEGSEAVGGSGGVSALLAHLAARDAGQLRHVLPALTAALRSAMEVCLIETSGAAAGEGGGEGGAPSRPPPRSPAVYARLRRILELIAAIAGNRGLPAEVCAGELLALIASVLLHKLPWAPSAPSTPAQGGGAGGAAPPASSATSLGKRARVEADSASATRARVSSLVDEELKLRAYAADVFSATVGRAVELWPSVSHQAAGMLLDQLTLCVEIVENKVKGKAAVLVADVPGGVHGWETLFGAAAGLCRLSDLPPSLTPTLLDSVNLLLPALTDFAQESAGRVASGEAVKTFGELGVWQAQWAGGVAVSLNIAARAHLSSA